MPAELPDDLVAFLHDGRQFEYDSNAAEIGRIKLKRDTDLVRSIITTLTGCQSIIDDPYNFLEGSYQIDVYDLVKESEDYDVEGLFCWIVELQRFGSVDPEHGDVITFPNLTWTELTKNPMPYLDAQWSGDEVGVRVLPWLHFPFKLSKLDVDLRPYGSQCRIHCTPLTVQAVRRLPLFDVMQRREAEDWLQNYHTTFPCSGLPVTDDEFLCCTECRAAEDSWVQTVLKSIVPIDVAPNAHGWINCPYCGQRFLPAFTSAFVDGMHLLCGQKLNILS